MKKIVIGLVLLFLFLTIGVTSASWYNIDWSNRKEWTVDNVGDTSLTNYPAYVNVTKESEMQNDWDDVIFTDSNNNLIPFELENYTSSYAYFWVNISSIPGSGTYSGYIYYGNPTATSQANPEGVWDSDTVMVHHFEDLNDSTSHNNDGTSYGASYNDSGKIDGGYDFDGTNDYVDCGNDASLDITDAITIEAWVKRASVSNFYEGIVSKLWSGEYTGYALNVRNDNRFFFHVRDGSSAEDIESNTAYTDTNWHHLVAVRRHGVNYLYVDSIKQTDTGSLSIASNTHYLQIGRYYGNVNNFYCFNGTIDEVRISSTARSANWIKQSYEMVVNQSTWVSWGEEEKEYPSVPVITGNRTGNFWVNYTFTEGSGYPLTYLLATDSYNISWANNTNSGWQNGTTELYFNHSTQPHSFLILKIWAFNTTKSKLSETYATDNVTVPNNPPVILNCTGITFDETGQKAYLDLNYSDKDGDTCLFSKNISGGDLNETSGEFSINLTEEGRLEPYVIEFCVNDSYGGKDCCVATIGTIQMFIYMQNKKIIKENKMIAETWLFLVFAIIMFALIIYSFIDRYNPYYANIFASFFATFIAFLLATWCLGDLIDRPELSYFFIATGVVMLFATIIFVIDAIQEYIPLTERRRREAEERKAREMEEWYL